MAYKIMIDDGMVPCLECGNEFHYGRTDQKFCCSECKNKYNNRRRQTARIIKLKITKILDDNYDILGGLIVKKIKKISVFELSQYGYNFAYFTSYYKCGHRVVYSCYDINFQVSCGKVSGIGRTESMAALHSREKLIQSQNSVRVDQKRDALQP